MKKQKKIEELCKHKWRLVIYWRDSGQVMYWECEKCGETRAYCEWSCA